MRLLCVAASLVFIATSGCPTAEPQPGLLPNWQPHPRSNRKDPYGITKRTLGSSKDRAEVQDDRKNLRQYAGAKDCCVKAAETYLKQKFGQADPAVLKAFARCP